jgi:hypothetical protein
MALSHVGHAIADSSQDRYNDEKTETHVPSSMSR